MKRILIFILILFYPLNSFAANNKKTHSTLHTIIFYVPNRVLDVFDIFRCRARIGPGISIGARATKVASGFIGTHSTVYLGLPGPRLRPFPKSPIGLESNNGATLSVIDATVNAGLGPNYSKTEFGLGTQILLLGADIGVDPFEALDFITGFLTIDLRNDDF